MHLNDLNKQLTNYRTLLGAIIAVVLGIGAIMLAEMVTSLPSWLQALLRQIGSLLIASVAIALLWELFSRRALLAELLAQTRLASEIDETGLVGLSAKWRGEVDWPKLFRSAQNLDIFFIYGRTWRNNYLDELQQFALRPGTQLNLVLPDPNDFQITTELAKRIGLSPPRYPSALRKPTTSSSASSARHSPLSPTSPSGSLPSRRCSATTASTALQSSLFISTRWRKWRFPRSLYAEAGAYMTS
jgi:hypothetical protein